MNVPRLTVSIPARPDVLTVLRAVVGSSAARLGFPVDQIDDLRLAASEVATLLIEEQPRPPALTLSLTDTDDGIELILSRTSAATKWPPSGDRRTLASLMLGTLADESSFEETDEGCPAVRIVKRVGS
jgi:serine/threonine-protein kinase RsbW